MSRCPDCSDMAEYPQAFETIVQTLRRLPGVGRKSAIRYAFGIIGMSEEEVDEFACNLTEARKSLHSCVRCGNICEGDLCPVCLDDNRDGETLCVVEDVRALLALEKADGFNGRYHVLGGTISPLDGRGPEDVNLASLPGRIKNEGVKEVIIATNPTVDGESTALYIARMLKNTGVKVTRIGYGIPAGGDLDYADELTLTRAIDGRKEI